MQARAGRWRTANWWLYRCAHALAALRARRPLRPRALPARPADAALPVLHLANGRLGDALLAAAYTRRYREWFGRRVVAVGRPETAAVVAPLVDAFVPFDPSAPPSSPHGAGSAARALAGGHAFAFGDLHLCHGGQPLLALASSAGARHLVVYDGWIDRRLQAPSRRWPAGAYVVPMRSKPAPSTEAARLHVGHDLAHYHAGLAAHLGLRGFSPPEALELPEAALDRGAAAARALPPGYVACQPSSSQPKKDWPLAAFRALFAHFGERTFVLLGHRPGKGERALDLANVRDLRGLTSVPEALAVVAGARAFVGVDSALAHAAALAGVPAVVAMPAATPGYFFPYPDGLARAPVTAVWAPEFAACAGCGGICAHEPIWRSRRRGFPCVRALGPEAVARALAQALAAGVPAAPLTLQP